MLLLETILDGAAHASGAEHWVRTWSVAMQAPDALDYFPSAAKTFSNVTIRQLIRPSLGGQRVRVLFSNEFGNRALVIGRARIALAGAIARSEKALSFNGHPTVTIPSGATMLSDPADLTFRPLATIAISIYLPQSTMGTVSTVHQDGRQSGSVSGPGDFTAAEAPVISDTVSTYFFLGAVDVVAAPQVTSIIALGDSITDGYGSSMDANKRWPDHLAERMLAQRPARYSVVNAGISGNRLLRNWMGPSALSRFDRDVLAVPNAKYLIILEGINDIGAPDWAARPEESASAEDLIGALQQLIIRAHEHGILVLGSTLTPTAGCADRGYDTPEGEAKRQFVNAWIRTSGAFDGVLDFDKTIRDPTAPTRIFRKYDSGDHLHPGDAGYAAMADAIDLTLFK